MKILQINTSSQRGGATKIALTLHEHLNKAYNYQSVFAYGRDVVSNCNNFYKFTLAHEVYLHAISTRACGIEGSGSFLSTKKLINYINVFKPDLVHLHNLHGYYLNHKMFVKYLKEKKYPVVWTFHDCWPITGSCAYFMDCSKYKDGCGSCPYISNYPKNYVDASGKMWSIKKDLFGSGWQPVIVTPSQWLKKIVSGSFLKKHRVEVIPNGIDTQMFKPVEKEKAKSIIGLPNHKKVLLYVAMDLKDERKGAKYFLTAIQKLSRLDDIIVLTVGKKYEYSLDKNVEFREYGFIKDKEYLSHIYSAADLFCITSLDEVFGLTVTEAMACGTPVVGFDVGGIPEQVTSDCGIVLPPKNSIKLAEAIDELIENQGKREIFSANCRQRVLDNYSTENMVRQYVSLYQELVK